MYNNIDFNRTYTFDEHYFDIIDTKDKAYWIGFLWGDGYVHSDGLTLSISTKDIKHLEKFKKCLNSKHPIKEYKNKNGYDSDSYCRIGIYSKYLSDILINKYGIKVGRTDFSKILNTIKKDYYKDVIRGLIDSDGCIHLVYKNGKIDTSILSLIASDSVLSFFVLFLNNVLKEDIEYKRYKRHAGKDLNMYNINIQGNYRVFCNLFIIYNDSNIYLDRKYDLYITLFNYIKNNIIICKETTGKGSDTVKRAKLKYIKFLSECGI